MEVLLTNSPTYGSGEDVIENTSATVYNLSPLSAPSTTVVSFPNSASARIWDEPIGHGCGLPIRGVWLAQSNMKRYCFNEPLVI